MPVTKSSAPGNDPATTNQAAKTGEVQPSTSTDQHAPTETGQGNTPHPADAREDQTNQAGYHDSQSGKAVTAEGVFLDEADGDRIPAHRIVADNWADREANTK